MRSHFISIGVRTIRGWRSGTMHDGCNWATFQQALHHGETLTGYSYWVPSRLRVPRGEDAHFKPYTEYRQTRIRTKKHNLNNIPLNNGKIIKTTIRRFVEAHAPVDTFYPKFQFIVETSEQQYACKIREAASWTGSRPLTHRHRGPDSPLRCV